MPPPPFQLQGQGGVTQWHQPVVVQRVAFHHVDDIELITRASNSIIYPEEEPLCVPVRIHVSLQHEVVLILPHQRRPSQIPALETALKGQHRIFSRVTTGSACPADCVCVIFAAAAGSCGNAVVNHPLR